MSFSLYSNILAIGYAHDCEIYAKCVEKIYGENCMHAGTLLGKVFFEATLRKKDCLSLMTAVLGNDELLLS